MNRYLKAQGMLDFKPGFWPDGWRIVRVAAAIMPWELARARRIVDLRFRVDQEYYADVQQTLAAGDGIRKIWDRKHLQDVGLSPSFGVELPFPERMVESALLGGVGGEETLIFKGETRCRALRIQFALLAFRAHGTLPSDLKQLVPNQIAKLPIDVYSSQQFLYRSEGVPYPVAKEPHSVVIDASSPSGDSLEPGTPFICSIGPYLARRDGHPAGPGEPSVEDLQFPNPYAAQFDLHDGTPLNNEQNSGTPPGAFRFRSRARYSPCATVWDGAGSPDRFAYHRSKPCGSAIRNASGEEPAAVRTACSRGRSG